MGTRTDAALALIVLAAVALAFVLADASVRLSAVFVGGLGSIAFELGAARDPELVRHYWENAVVQGGSVVLAVLGVAVGAVVAPSSVLSFALGSLATYLAFLAGVTVVRTRR